MEIEKELNNINIVIFDIKNEIIGYDDRSYLIKTNFLVHPCKYLYYENFHNIMRDILISPVKCFVITDMHLYMKSDIVTLINRLKYYLPKMKDDVKLIIDSNSLFFLRELELSFYKDSRVSYYRISHFDKIEKFNNTDDFDTLYLLDEEIKQCDRYLAFERKLHNEKVINESGC